ncbi:hypothetical protein MANES_09G020501v8 [Manihot esculenta]|uniref:Uncharacterized protein n=1 Tax=Manihot esculenta TaxID=3983 RepID=A0ACB7H267_MANES|nr:hypothetical protein MANES_09G020501v8 [Manihot esculenta]
MSTEKYDVFLVCLNRKNYSAWAFKFQIRVKGKDLWGHKDEYAKWEVMLKSWHGSQARPFNTAAKMWNYLKKIYSQNNTARRIVNSISDFNSHFMDLWAEYKDIVYANSSSDGLTSVQTVHEATKYSVQSHESPAPSLDVCLNELLHEEERLLTQTAMEQQKSTSLPRRDRSVVQCFCCKGFGHFASNCTKKYCNYCKKDGHIIKECPIRPPKKNATAFTASVDFSAAPISVDTENAQQNAPTPVQTLTPEIVQQMIISVFYALGLSAFGSTEEGGGGEKEEEDWDGEIARCIDLEVENSVWLSFFT